MPDQLHPGFHIISRMVREMSLVRIKPSQLLRGSKSQPIIETTGFNHNVAAQRSYEFSVEDDYREKIIRALNVSTCKEEFLNCESGTDADDENFKKGSTKMRSQNFERSSLGIYLSSSQKGLPSTEGDEISLSERTLISSQIKATIPVHNPEAMKEYSQMKKLDYIRKSVELGIMVFILGLLCTDDKVRHILEFWKRELFYLCVIVLILLVSYPCKISNNTNLQQSEIRSMHSAVPIINDPAPLLYPPFLSILVSLVIFRNQPYDFVANIVLAVASIPTNLLPSFYGLDNLNTTHWIMSLMPLYFNKAKYKHVELSLENPRIDLEALVLLSPLNQSLCLTLAEFTSSSLLPAELQLLSISLINLLLHARSPQAIILKSLVWGGGISILVSCRHILKWSIMLSRTPKWRFRHTGKDLSSKRQPRHFMRTWSIKKHEASGFVKNNDPSNSDDASDSVWAVSRSCVLSRSRSLRSIRRNDENSSTSSLRSLPNISKIPYVKHKTKSFRNTRKKSQSKNDISRASKNNTLLNRRNKNPSSSERSLHALSLEQATIRKWIYATYVYLCLVAIILVGIRKYVEVFALSGREPLGWILGYMFGDLQILRNFVNSRSLQQWIQVPLQPNSEHTKLSCRSLLECLRLTYVGEANTRLIISCYWLIIFTIGLKIIWHLFPYFEVDTRRKSFHFIMVTVLLPVTFIDPTFTALALSLALAIFLLLELIRSTRLPPISKPLAKFFAPFVDGRDLKGPVVVSHIFLLLGSAIPFWLTLGSLPRMKSINLDGWRIETRELSMIAGVICVGIGDASASIIGRRYGRRKWPWGSEKSIEGSIAFTATAVSGLVISKIWLRLGGWQANNSDAFTMTILKSGIAACIASLAEAAVTSVNDNVIVPIILWLCVKGLDI